MCQFYSRRDGYTKNYDTLNNNKKINEYLIQLKFTEEKRIESRLELEKELQDAVFNNDIDNVKECMKKIDPVNLKQVINTTTSGNHTLLYRYTKNNT